MIDVYTLYTEYFKGDPKATEEYLECMFPIMNQLIEYPYMAANPLVGEKMLELFQLLCLTGVS